MRVTLQLNQVTYELALLIVLVGPLYLQVMFLLLNQLYNKSFIHYMRFWTFLFQKSLGAESLEENDGNGFSWLW